MEEIEITSKTFAVAVIRCSHCGEIAAKMNIERVDAIGMGQLEISEDEYKKRVQ